MKYLLLIGLLLSSVTSVYAQSASSTFNVRFLYGSDTTPPTTPVLVSATAISPTQIDLDWTASTDNYVLQGYVVSRGTSTIATTTLTSFSDTGVSASTTYSYSVQAFDNSSNYSSSSNSISTTTPDYPVTPVTPTTTDDGSQEGTVARIVTRDVSVVPGVSTSSLAVETARPVRLTVRWGRSTDYELGFLINEVYTKNHLIPLTDLEPGTTYEYQIIAQTPFGLEAVVASGQFTTQNPAVATTPANVVRFLAQPAGTDVELSWQLPAGEDVAFVRVVRSHLGFPAHPQNGAVVYQGLAGGFTDADILSEYSPVYYTAFAYNAQGKVSSGAIAIAFAQSGTPGAEPDEGSGRPGVPPVKVTEATSSVAVDRFTPDMRVPGLSEVFVTQKGIQSSFLTPDISLSPMQAFVVQIPVAAVAGNLKSIVVTVLDPTDNKLSYSFLLRINEDKTYYQAVIPELSVIGDSVLEVHIYDYEALTVATYKTPVAFIEMEQTKQPVVFPDMFFQGQTPILLVGVLLGAVLLILLLVLRHRREDKDDE